VVYIDRGISAGMQIGIEDAARAGRPVEYRILVGVTPKKDTEEFLDEAEARAYKDMETDRFHHTPYSFFISLAGRDVSPLKLLIEQTTVPANALMLVSVPINVSPD
jgi:hypothetical protein